MRIENKMYRQVCKLQAYPAALRPALQNYVMSRFVPFLKTGGIRFEVLTREEVVVSVKNVRKVQNHIHNVHACVMATLAETATGFVVAMNTPDDKLMLLKSMHIDYVKRSQGDMRAQARLTDEQVRLLQQEERGNFVVPCTVTDQSGEPPIEVEMVWAWVPKKPPQAPAQSA